MKLNFFLTWLIIYTDVAEQVPTFTITDTNLYVPVVTLSTPDNAKLLPQLKSGFKRTISWNKYLSKPELLAQNANLNHLIEPSFQGVNRLFVLAFEDDAQYIYFKRYYKMIAVDLSKQQALVADPKAIQQINFAANLVRDENTKFYFILEEAKKKLFLNFHKEL